MCSLKSDIAAFVQYPLFRVSAGNSVKLRSCSHVIVKQAKCNGFEILYRVRNLKNF